MLYVNPLATPFFARSQQIADEAARERLALQELEQHFIYMLLQEMRKSLPEESLLEGGSTRRMYTEMLDDALSREMAQSGRFGLAQQIADQLHADQVRNNITPAEDSRPESSVR